MKVRQGGVPGVPGQSRVQQGQETITLVPHAPCHSDPEEELVTITTQATPGARQARDRVVVQAIPGILVTDISAGACTAATQSLDGATLPAVPASDAPCYTTTTTTHCVPRDAPAKLPTALLWRRGVVSRRGCRFRAQTAKHPHTNSSRAAASPDTAVGQGESVLGDSVHGQGTAVTPDTLTCESRTTLTTSSQPALPPTPARDLPARPCRVGSACPDEGSTTPPTTCSFCRRVSNILTIFNLKAPLPHSLLETASLLQCLGLTPPAGATPTNSAGLATLCQECHALLCEGDQAYHHLMEVVVGMKQCWAGLEARVPPVPGAHHRRNKKHQAPVGACLEVRVPPVPAIQQGSNKKQQSPVRVALEARVPPVPATHQGSNSDQQAPVGPSPAPAQSTRRLRPILPKPTSPVSCGLCGVHLARLEEWHLHITTHHRLSPRWRSPRLQAALKMCLARELQHGSGLQGTWCCPACSCSFPQQEEFLEHLRGHHSMTVDKDLLVCIGGGATGAGQGTAGQWRGSGGGAWMGKEEEVEEVIKKEIEEEEEIIEDEELIEENERILKDGEQEKEEEEEEETVEEEEVGEEERLRSRVNSLLEEQQTQPDLEECGRESESRGAHTMQGQGDAGLGRGARWRCRVCAAVFSSQQEHDTHKTATHPGSVRAKRGTTRPSAPHQPSRRGRPVDGDHQDHERPAVACQEGAIVILEGDGQGGVTHHRLQPSAITEDLQGPAQQNTLPLTGGAVSLPCPVCTEVFGDRLSLVRHRRAAHPQAGPGNGVVLVECPLCGRRLAGSPALQHHMARVHHHPSHPPLRYRCRLCLCQCHTRPQLERHMRERHGAPPPPPPVQCGRCGKTYSARYIDSHLANMHGDVTRFPCAFCPMKFGTRTGLRAHVSLEHANTTWACQECPLQFAKYHQLRQHRLYVHSHAEHRCPLCPRSFKRRCDLTEHTKRRHQERQPQECSFCPKVYSDRKRLRIHLMRKHGVAWEDTLARGYARRQRENNCLRRRHHQQHQHPHSPQEEKQQAPREDSEGCQGGMLEGQPEYSVVHLTEAPHPLADTISYIILEET